MNAKDIISLDNAIWLCKQHHTPTNSLSKEYLFYSLSYEKITPFITESAQPQITRANLSNMKLLVADQKIINKFDSIANDVRKEIQNIFDENNELEKLKDFLNPLLMNGQIGFVE